MPNTREKLIELLLLGAETTPCAFDDVDCKGKKCSICEREAIADNLIANGVRLEEKQATSDESKWIPVTERLPEYKTEVLTRSKMGTSGHSFAVAALWMVDDEIGWVFDDGFEPQDIAEITHWMPLPEPPKEG